MDKISKVKSMSIWIFIVPFLAINTCLIMITQFHGLFPNQENIIHNTIPYIDGGVSISRTARFFPAIFIWLGHNENPWFITGAPISWLLCLHPIMVPLIWSIWINVCTPGTV